MSCNITQLVKNKLTHWIIAMRTKLTILQQNSLDASSFVSVKKIESKQKTAPIFFLEFNKNFRDGSIFFRTDGKRTGSTIFYTPYTPEATDWFWWHFSRSFQVRKLRKSSLGEGQHRMITFPIFAPFFTCVMLSQWTSKQKYYYSLDDKNINGCRDEREVANSASQLNSAK